MIYEKYSDIEWDIIVTHINLMKQVKTITTVQIHFKTMNILWVIQKLCSIKN